MSQHDDILDKLIAGETLTPLTALLQCRTLSLSQRCGELRRLGFAHEHKTLKVNDGKLVGHYWMTRRQRTEARKWRKVIAKAAA